jgi:hypothetical protein
MQSLLNSRGGCRKGVAYSSMRSIGYGIMQEYHPYQYPFIDMSGRIMFCLEYLLGIPSPHSGSVQSLRNRKKKKTAKEVVLKACSKSIPTVLEAAGKQACLQFWPVTEIATKHIKSNFRTLSILYL